MASLDDWETRKARVQEQLDIQLPALVETYQTKTRAVGDLIQQVQKLEDEKGKLQHEILSADQKASTADREFLERKETLPDPFKPSKIYTVQDFTFFLFFMSYFILLVAVSMIFQEKVKTFFGGLLLLLVIVVLMYRYI